MGRFLNWKDIIIAFVMIVAVGIRLIYLVGDPPVNDISRSGVFYVDEGTYVHNVVNKILFDKWFLENDYNAIVNVPIFSIFQYLLLNVLGISLKTLRATGVIYTALSLIILWYLFKKENLTISIIAVILSSLNYFYLIYNRLALIENLLIVFLLLTALFLFNYYRKDNIKWLMGATLIFWCGFFVKATILFFLPMLILTVLKKTVSKDQKLKHILVYSIESSFILIFAYIVWVAPHEADWNYFQTGNIHQNISESLFTFLINYSRYFSNLKLFQFMPLTYTIVLFYLTYLMYEYYLTKKISFHDWFFSGWIICGFLFLGFFKYSPPRLSLILIPPIVVLTASFIYRLFHNQIKLAGKNLFILFAPIGILVTCQIIFGLYRIIIYKQNYLSCYLPLFSILLIPLFLILKNYKIDKKIPAYLLFFSIVLINGFQIYKYYSTIQFSYYHAICDMKNIIENQESDHKILLGDIAPLVSVELKTKAVNINFKKETEEIRILQYRPNLLVLQENKELNRLTKKIPHYFQRVELVKRYRIFNNYRNNDDAYFYRIDNNFTNSKLVVKLP